MRKIAVTFGLVIITLLLSNASMAASISNANYGSVVIRDGVLGYGHAGVVISPLLAFGNPGDDPLLTTDLIIEQANGTWRPTGIPSYPVTYKDFLGGANYKGHFKTIDTQWDSPNFRADVVMFANQTMLKSYTYIDLYAYNFDISYDNNTPYADKVPSDFRCDGIAEWSVEQALGLHGKTLSGNLGFYAINNPNAPVRVFNSHYPLEIANRYGRDDSAFPLRIDSDSPSSGVAIVVDKADNVGYPAGPLHTGTGVHTLKLLYSPNTTVTLTAPATAPNGNVFDTWWGCTADLGGTLNKTARTCTISIGLNLAAYRVQASYVSPGATQTPPTVITTPATNIGSNSATLNATITNDGGSAILERRFEWNTSPSFSGSGSATNINGGTITVSGNNYSYLLTGLASNTPYYFRPWARNSIGWAPVPAALSFTTGTTQAVPVITSTGTTSGTVNQFFSYQITATNSPTSYGASGLPAWLSVNSITGLISGTPTASSTFSVTVTATNAGGTGSKTVTITIATGAPVAPVITSASTANGTVNQFFSYQITANNSPTSYGASGLPAWLSVNSITGLISGTPTASSTFSITVTATNVGGTNSKTVTITINGLPVNTGDVTIVSSGSSSGGSWVGNTWTPSTTGSTVLASEIVSHLAIGATAISATISGDIIVNGAVSWSANNILTLTSVRDIKVNANISATGNTSGLILGYGAGRSYTLANGATITLSGATPTLKIGVAGSAVSYTVINSLGVAGDTSGITLQGMNGNLSGHYALGSNIDATATVGWNAGAGLMPVAVGNGSTSFIGQFDGLGHIISNLTINLPTTVGVGLFGYVGIGSAIRNVGIEAGSVNGLQGVGGLAGTNQGAISNSYINGNVSGGANDSGNSVRVGGLVGMNLGSIGSSYATGNVSASGDGVGGLIGWDAGTVSYSYATGNVSGTSQVGGLAGIAIGTISTSYATGNVSGTNYVGGLVGTNNGTISNIYATGNVSALGYIVGGLAGYNGGSVSTSYATGRVSGTDFVGGLVGENFNNTSVNSGSISNSYWDTQTSGQTIGFVHVGAPTSATATSLTTAQMMTQASFIGFDFTNIWWMNEGNTRPLLRNVATAASACTYSRSPVAAGFAATSSLGVLTVTPSSSSCSWTAVSNASWITITSGSSGTGSGTVTYSVATNMTGSTRTATITLTGSTITVTQTGFAAALYFPHVDTSLPWQTEIAIINTSDQIVTGTLRGLSNAGQLEETKAVTLSAHGRRQITVADEFINPTDIGYIIFDTDSATVEGYTKFYQAGKYRAAIPAVKEVNTADIYISHIDSGAQWWTGISLVNTTAETKTLTIIFNNGQSVPYSLNANEHKAFTIGGLLNQPLQPDIRSAVITNASGIIGLELFGSIGSSSQMDGILLSGNTTPTIYYPHVAGGDWWTGIVAYNPSESTSTITITPYNAQGTLLAISTFSIAGKGKYIGMVSDLGLPDQTAWFKIESTAPLSGFELFGTADGNQLAAYAGGGGTGEREGVFAKIEKNGWTGIAFVNTEDSAASVTLTAYNDTGTTMATRVLTVDGHAKVLNYAETIFSPQAISGATYIAYSSDRNVVGFQLNGSSDDMMLDGLPGM